MRRQSMRCGGGRPVDLDDSGVDVSALGLEPAPLAGSDLAVTFSFAMAGSVSAWLPVVSAVP